MKVGATTKRTRIIGDMVVENIEGIRVNKRLKPTVAVKSIPGSTKKDMKHHVRGYLQDSFHDTAIFHFGISYLKSNKTDEDIATVIMNLEICLRKETDSTL